MASISQFSGDWALLIAEAKRKNPAVRSAAENAQQLAKNSDVHSVITTSLDQQKTFTSPFFLALDSGNDKLIACSLLPLSRLASAKALTSEQISQLLTLLSRFDLAAHTMETKLKILQVLPLVMQNYGTSRPNFLQVVGLLVHLINSSDGVVANAASATLQQILSSLFDALKSHESDADPSTHVLVPCLEDEKSAPFSLDELEYTCHYTFWDLCSIASGDDLIIFKDLNINISAALENIENIVSFHPQVFYSNANLAYVLRLKAVPVLLKMLNDTSVSAYPLIIRSLRIVYLLATHQLQNLVIETEIILLYINHIVLNGSSHTAAGPGTYLQHLIHPQWEQIVVIEIYKMLYSSFSNVRSLFEAYDSNPQKKNVIAETFSVLKIYMSNNFSFMISKNGITAPNSSSTTPVMTKNNSLMKVALIDHLERTEPPVNKPELYTPFMLLSILNEVSNGIADFVANMSLNVDSETIGSEVEFITTLIEALFPEMIQLFDIFLHFSMETDFFVSLVTSLQRYTHAVGLLDLTELRNKLLILLAKCVCINSIPEAEKGRSSSAAHILSIGETIVDSISSTIATSGSQLPTNTEEIAERKHLFEQKPSLKARYFNSRLIICLGALLNVAISLGTTLASLWNIICITLQWVEYFLNGPDDVSEFKNQNDLAKIGHPTLSSQDLTEIKLMKQKCYFTALNYQESTLMEVLEVLKDLLKQDRSQELLIEIQPCPFNRSFYVKLILRLSQLEYSEFLFLKSVSRNFISSLLISTATDRSLAPSFRLMLANSYALFIVSTTVRGFKTHPEEKDLAELFLKDLKSFLDALFALGTPKDHLTTDCEAEIHLIILLTLHEHINEYDTYYQSYWNLAFEILNTVFVRANVRHDHDHKLEEKIRLLISTSFGTLKMILDEFLSSLPSEHFKPLIDTLLNFCQQNYDINISFSAVSYFWLISDCINSRMDNCAENLPVFFDVLDLELLLASNISQDSNYYQMLNTYLLARLAVLAHDQRSQVREGSIQTLFQILDVQGKILKSWSSILNIVFPHLLEWNDLRSDTPPNKQKDIMVSLNLVLSNLVSIYSKYMMDFKREPDVTELFWTRLLTFLSSMLHLRWCELNLKVFESYLDLIISFSVDTLVPVQLVDHLFKFWLDATIEYDFVNPSYQDGLVVYLDGFKKLLPFTKRAPVEFPVTKVISNLNKCARYPILKPNQNDKQKPTELQQAALDGLILVGKVLGSEEIDAIIAQQLAHICAYPFETRSRIEAKLSTKFGGRIKIPSFQAVSQLSFDFLFVKIPEIKSMTVLFKDTRLHKILRSLLFMVHSHAPGLHTENEKPLWVKCNEMISVLLHRAIDECLHLMNVQEGMWELVVEAITVNFEDRTEDEENYSITQYQLLAEKLIPALFESGNSDQIAALTKSLYKHSFMYEPTSVEEELLKSESPLEELCFFDFDSGFGTTRPMSVKKNGVVRLMCLKELFKTTISGDLAATENGEALVNDLCTRIAFALRRFIADNRLLLLKPVPKIQQIEIMVVLSSLKDLQKLLEETKQKKLRQLVSQCIPFCQRVEGLSTTLANLVLD